MKIFLLLVHLWIYIYLFKRVCFIQKKSVKHGKFDSDIVNFPFWMGKYPILPRTVFTFLKLFDFARVSSHVTD